VLRADHPRRAPAAGPAPHETQRERLEELAVDVAPGGEVVEELPQVSTVTLAVEGRAEVVVVGERWPVREAGDPGEALGPLREEGVELAPGQVPRPLVPGQGRRQRVGELAVGVREQVLWLLEPLDAAVLRLGEEEVVAPAGPAAGDRGQAPADV